MAELLLRRFPRVLAWRTTSAFGNGCRHAKCADYGLSATIYEYTPELSLLGSRLTNHSAYYGPPQAFTHHTALHSAEPRHHKAELTTSSVSLKRAAHSSM